MDVREAILAGEPVPVPVIDCHTHMGGYTHGGWYQYRPSMADTLNVMNRCGVDAAVTAHHAMVGGSHELANRLDAELADRYPGRIWAYITVNPSWPLPRVEKEIAAYVNRRGFVGFKLLPGYQGSLLSPAHECALAAADARGMPVLVHTWHRSASVKEFEPALLKYPKVPLLIAHCGGYRESYVEFIALSKDYPNACLELCGSLYCDWWLEDIVEAAGAERLFFGTDMINCELRYEIGRVGLADISEDDKRRIFADNFCERIKPFVGDWQPGRPPSDEEGSGGEP